MNKTSPKTAREGLEMAAKVCDRKHDEFAKRSYPPPSILKELATAIRALASSLPVNSREEVQAALDDAATRLGPYAAEPAALPEGDKIFAWWLIMNGQAVAFVGEEPPNKDWIWSPLYRAPIPKPEDRIAKPARVGNTIFGIGVSVHIVADRAVREYEYESVAALPGWIPVGEKLPWPNTWVLVHNSKWTGVGKHVPLEDDGYMEESECWQDEHTEFIEHLGPKVTHWMPLPAAPKPDEEGKDG